MENLGYYAYRTLEDGAMASSSTAMLAATKGIDFEEKEEEQPEQMEATMTEGPGAEETGNDVVDVVEEVTEKEPEAKESTEGP